MDSPTQNTSLQRLQNVEKRIIKVLELAGGVMDELANPAGPRKESINQHCREFMQSIKDIQVTLRDEIKSACEYRPFEKCDYNSRIGNEICLEKLKYVLSQLDGMKETTDAYNGEAWAIRDGMGYRVAVDWSSGIRWEIWDGKLSNDISFIRSEALKFFR